MAVTGGIYHYSRGPKPPKVGKRGRDNPEEKLQAAIVQYLTYALPPNFLWTADASGVWTSDSQALKLKRTGVKPGNPDIRILFPSGVTRYWELKAGQTLSPAQCVFRDACLATGRDIWELIKNPEEAEACLLRWKVPVRCALAQANRYAMP